METVTTPLPHFSFSFLPISSTFLFWAANFFSVMLAQKVLHFAVLAAAFDGRQMVKPFIPFSINRLLFFRQQGLELTTHSGRIDHLILGTSRMDAHALDGDSCRSRVEVFIFQFTQGSAVNSISNLGPNFSRSKNFVPSPTSSSGVKPMRIFPCLGASGRSRRSARVMISATPALSSAPKNVSFHLSQ